MQHPLTYGDNIIGSVEGSQQGDQLSGLEILCESIQSTLLERETLTAMRFVDVARDVQKIVDLHLLTGLILNPHRCEITAKSFNIIDKFPIFKNFKRVALQNMTLLGAPVLERRVVEGRDCYPSEIDCSFVNPTSPRRPLFVNELDCNAKTSLYSPDISMRQKPSSTRVR